MLRNKDGEILGKDCENAQGFAYLKFYRNQSYSVDYLRVRIGLK